MKQRHLPKEFPKHTPKSEGVEGRVNDEQNDSQLFPQGCCAEPQENAPEWCQHQAAITIVPPFPAPPQLPRAPTPATCTLLSHQLSLPPVPPTPKSSCCTWRIKRRKKKKTRIIIIIKTQWTHFLGFTENLLGMAEMAGSPCEGRSAGGSCILPSLECIKTIWARSRAPCELLSIQGSAGKGYP